MIADQAAAHRARIMAQRMGRVIKGKRQEEIALAIQHLLADQYAEFGFSYEDALKCAELFGVGLEAVITTRLIEDLRREL